MESWQGALLPVEGGGLVVLDAPGLQHAAGLGVDVVSITMAFDRST